MKKLVIPVLLLLNILPGNVYGQHTMRMKYRIPADDVIKSATDTVFLISPEFEMTGMVIRIDTSDNFLNAFIIEGNDTIYITADEHMEDTSSYFSSNLIVFKNKLSSFYFYPSSIDKEIEFFLIDASPSKKVLKKSGRKKKRCRLFRARND